YLHEQISGERALYNICKAWRLSGTVSQPALRAALQYVIDRHELLRTAITIVDGVPSQQVRPTQIARFDVVDLPPDAPVVAEDEALEDFAASLLGLETGDIVRALLISRRDDRHVLGLL